MSELGVRCARCGASAITQSLASVLRERCTELHRCDVYEMSATGLLVNWLRARAASLTTSEFLPDVPPGEMRGGVRCQDVQRLTYADQSFDICTSTEVFEHVENDIEGLREIFRILRPGGLHVFTVPLNVGNPTMERTVIEHGLRTNVLPTEHHADRHGVPVFCYRNYGDDLLERLLATGLESASFCLPSQYLFGFGRVVVVARKAGTAEVR